MHADRFSDNQQAPTAAEVVRGVVRLVVAAALLWAVLAATGWVLKHLLGGLTSEVAANRALEARRVPWLDAATKVASHMANTEWVIAACVLAAVLLWWRTRQWWVAVIPPLAALAEVAVFLLVTLVADRPRPAVLRMDEGPPTSSYPSGHTGAAAAFCWSLALLATRIHHPRLRRVVIGVLVVVPFLVGAARVYRGMHYPSDVVFGLLNGGVCAVLAWRWLSHRHEKPSAAATAAVAGTPDPVAEDGAVA